ncbi:MAG: hypothetical protein DRJ52_11350 [Thermoprotei archaeon]|nr:MAG: hypothetical protein DRJ52_11350 [Thermoprotei archaeon]
MMNKILVNIKMLANLIKVVGRRHFVTKYAYFIWVFPFEAVELVVDLFLWFFFMQALGGGSVFKARYSADPIAYLITGIIAIRFLNYNVGNIYFVVRNLYYSGYMTAVQRLSIADYLSLNNISIGLWVLAQITWDYIRISIISLLYLTVGYIALGTTYYLTLSSIIHSLLAFTLGIIATAGLGLISASIYLYTGVHRGTEPIQWTTKILSKIASGLYFPIDVLPKTLQYFSLLLPHTYTLKVIRRALLMNMTTSTLLPDLCILSVQAAILAPLGYIFFSRALFRRIKLGPRL